MTWNALTMPMGEPVNNPVDKPVDIYLSSVNMFAIGYARSHLQYVGRNCRALYGMHAP